MLLPVLVRREKYSRLRRFAEGLAYHKASLGAKPSDHSGVIKATPPGDHPSI